MHRDELPEGVTVQQALAQLESEADARRARLSGNLAELRFRMRPANLLNELKDAAWAEVDRVTDEFLSIASDLVDDSVGWVKENRTLAAGGALTGLMAAAAVWYLSRKAPVPLYAAYDMEDPDMMNETDEKLGEKLGDKAADAWSKVKDEAHHLGEKAEGAYYAARSKAAVLSDSARERAAHAAEVARERAQEAAEAAREAADKAREAAGEAGRWAKKQPHDNPATVVLVALAAGALIGALLPRGNRRES